MNDPKRNLGNVELLGHFTALGNKMDGLSETTGIELRSINRHLEKLNSKVATNVGDIGELKLKEAKRDGAEEALKSLHRFKWQVAGGFALSLLTMFLGMILAASNVTISP